MADYCQKPKQTCLKPIFSDGRLLSKAKTDLFKADLFRWQIIVKTDLFETDLFPERYWLGPRSHEVGGWSGWRGGEGVEAIIIHLTLPRHHQS